MLDTTPVLIGQGQFTYRGAPGEALTPLQMIDTAARAAARDAGLAQGALAGLDAVGVVGFTIDAEGALSRLPVPRMANPPASLARVLGAAPRWSVYSHMGGNSPQQLINIICQRIAEGETDFALAVGAEFLGSLLRRLAQNLPLEGFGDEAGPPPERIGEARAGTTPIEAAHGLGLPVNTYPLFENALRARDRRSLADHQRRLGALFSPFTAVAADNPHAWFRQARTADELVEVTAGAERRTVTQDHDRFIPPGGVEQRGVELVSQAPIQRVVTVTAGQHDLGDALVADHTDPGGVVRARRTAGVVGEPGSELRPRLQHRVRGRLADQSGPPVTGRVAEQQHGGHGGDRSPVDLGPQRLDPEVVVEDEIRRRVVGGVAVGGDEERHVGQHRPLVGGDGRGVAHHDHGRCSELVREGGVDGGAPPGEQPAVELDDRHGPVQSDEGSGLAWATSMTWPWQTSSPSPALVTSSVVSHTAHW